MATKISYVNAIAAVCEAVGADVNDVVLGMGYDKRIGQEFLRPGPGWGGSCFPKTPTHSSNRRERRLRLPAAQGCGRGQRATVRRVVDKVRSAAGGSLDGVRVAAWGITFKARTDDTRESPAIKIIQRLQAAGAVVEAYDPAISEDLEGISVVADPYAACEGAEVLAILTEWDEFKWLDLDKVSDAMSAARVVDARNLMDRNRMLQHGFDYQGIGRS